MVISVFENDETQDSFSEEAFLYNDSYIGKNSTPRSLETSYPITCANCNNALRGKVIYGIQAGVSLVSLLTLPLVEPALSSANETVIVFALIMNSKSCISLKE